MRGHVRRRGKTWSIVYDTGRDETGRRIQKWRSGFTTKKKAEEELNKVLGDISHGDHVEPPRVTFRAFCESTFLPHVDRSMAPSTAATYRRLLKRHVYGVIGSKELGKVMPLDVDRVYRHAMEKENPVAASTARVIGAVVSSALEFAVDKRLLRHNQARWATPPKAVRREGSVWTANETRRFLDSVADDPLSALWHLMVVSGVRRAEVAGLTWRNVSLPDEGRGSIEVVQQLVEISDEREAALPAGYFRIGSRAAFGPPKSKQGARHIPLDERTTDVMRKHRDAQLVARDLLGPSAADHDLVFTRPDGRPLGLTGLSAAFQVRRRAAGLPHVRLHDLRHGNGTIAGGIVASPEIVRKRMGHASLSQTQHYMDHRFDTAEILAADAIAAAIYDAE